MDGPIRNANWGLLVGLVLLGLVGTVAPSWAELNCGDTIGPNAVAFLKHGLTCPDDNPALTLEGNSILYLGGHTVDCAHLLLDPVGIQINGAGSILQHGTVTGCHTGVVAGGTGGHIVTKVTATGNAQDGFRIESDDNKLRYNTSKQNTVGYRVRDGDRNTLKGNLARDNGVGFLGESGNDNTFTKNRGILNNLEGGFVIVGNWTRLIGNLAKDNGNSDTDDGFDIIGNDNKLLWNKATGNFGNGFLIEPSSFAVGNKVLGNTARRNQGNGIRLRGNVINSTVLFNVALDNGLVDLRDDNVNCDNNTWKANWFRTSKTNPPDAGCIR